MVLTNTCAYSGRQVLPGYGKRFAKNDKSLHIFLNAKCAHHFHCKWSARKVVWTVVNRRNRGKDLVITSERSQARRKTKEQRAYGSLTTQKLDELRKKYSALGK